jgi:hypothetical protein
VIRFFRSGVLIATLGLLPTATIVKSQQPVPRGGTNPIGNRVPVNGMQMYYEVPGRASR